MNRVSYYFLNKMHDVQILDQDYQEHLYQFYEYGSHMLNYNIEITKEDFQKVFINHVWYLCIGISDEIETEKYRDCIPFLQQGLIKKFNIEENLKEKARRKIYTRLMAKC